MLVKEAKALAQQWVMSEALHMPGFAGAFTAGSIHWLPAEAHLPFTSDLDLWVVFAGATPGEKLGKFLYRGVVLEVSYLTLEQLQSPEQILGDYHLASTFRTPNILADPSGWLTPLQLAVAQDFAKRTWVYRRCEQARDKVLANLQTLATAAPWPDLVMAWLFAAGVTTHVLLVAGLRNPTVRRRYAAVQELLQDYGHRAFYEDLLALLGCAQMNRMQVEAHLAALTAVFDVAQTLIKTPFFFAADISEIGRPIALDGSRELIETGHHREAIFWIAATYSRCQKVLYHDAPSAIQAQFTPGYQRLLADLGITSVADLQQRGEAIKVFLPALWSVTEAILAANPGIEP